MSIDREQVARAFQDYVACYDASDPKIALKADHTLRVAALCDSLAKAEGLQDPSDDLCWLTGMLHDIGRFEQVRRWGTFYDSQSVNHAEFGADLLFGEGLIDRFVQVPDPALEIAIRNHNRLHVEDGLPAATLALCNVIRDADKIDILRVNVERPAQEIYGAPLEEIMAGEISPEVEQAFYEKHCVDRRCMRTLLDRRIGHFCFAFELVYPWARREMAQQGFLLQAMETPSSNPQTEQKLVQMRAFMTDWLASAVS